LWGGEGGGKGNFEGEGKLQIPFPSPDPSSPKISFPAAIEFNDPIPIGVQSESYFAFYAILGDPGAASRRKFARRPRKSFPPDLLPRDVSEDDLIPSGPSIYHK